MEVYVFDKKGAKLGGCLRMLVDCHSERNVSEVKNLNPMKSLRFFAMLRMTFYLIFLFSDILLAK